MSLIKKLKEILSNNNKEKNYPPLLKKAGKVSDTGKNNKIDEADYLNDIYSKRIPYHRGDDE